MIKLLRMFIKRNTMIWIIIAAGLFGMIKLLSSCSSGTLFFNYGYNIKDGHVYFKQQFPKPVIDIPNVDVASFKVMSNPPDTLYADNGYYGTDKNVVYYKGVQMEGSDGPSFKILDVNYAKDKNQCYYRGMSIAADPASFVIKNESYSADKGHIFRREMKVDDDASVFETFNEDHIVHTANTVTMYDEVVPISKGATFHYISNFYFSLNNSVYYWNKLLPQADANSFTAIDDFYSKTATNVYYQNKILPGANPVTFKVMDATYSHDDNKVFYYEKPIVGSDAKTFEILNAGSECSRDKNAIYHQENKINGFTAADLANKNHCISCSDTAVSFSQ